MSDTPRYRVENGFHCVDVRIDSVENMFDNRDPAPFRARDLDPDLVEYLLAAAEDVSHEKFKVVFWLGKAGQAGDVEPAFRAHTEYELARAHRNARRQRREGQIVLAIGVVALSLTVGGAQAVGNFPGSDAVRELLHVGSWVIMWRPIDTLVYQWLPLWRQRRMWRRLCTAPIEVRPGRPTLEIKVPLPPPASPATSSS